MQVVRQSFINGTPTRMSNSGTTISLMNPQQQGPALPGQQPAQGLTALLVMIAVLIILLAYCFWGAPWCRAFCRRRVCCFCPMDDPEGLDLSTSQVCHSASYTDEDDIIITVQENGAPAATPTIILLPFGRMLVVDGAVFAQLQADSRGLDLMELGENIIRTQRYQTGSSPSIFQTFSQVDSETTSKGMSPILDTFPPPTYDSIFGSRLFINDLPPSYSEVSLQLRNLAQTQAINENEMNHRNHRSRAPSVLRLGENICPIAEEESDRIAASEEDIRESTV